MKARDGLAKHTRSKTTAASKFVKRVQTCEKSTANNKSPPICLMTVQDSKESLDLMGQCNNGRDVSLASKKGAEQSVVMGIGTLHSIETVYFEVASKKTKESPSEKLPVSRAWIVSSTVFYLSSGQMAIKNIIILVSNDSRTCVHLFLGPPVL